MPTICVQALTLTSIKGKPFRQIHVLPNDSTIDYVSFIYYLPNDYYCEIKKTRKQPYSLRINFYFIKSMVFHLFTNSDMSQNLLLLDTNGYHLGWIQKDDCFILQFSEDEEFGHKALNLSHPYITIGRKINKVNGYANNQISSLFVNENILSSIHKHDKYLQKDFINYLSTHFKGSFYIYKTKIISKKLLMISETDYLFGISWVFPWTVALMHAIKYECYMTDATFRSMYPYTLSIFNVIFMNESIPIALGIFPTETANSYIRVWNHLKSLFDTLNIGEIKKKPFVCDL